MGWATVRLARDGKSAFAGVVFVVRCRTATRRAAARGLSLRVADALVRRGAGARLFVIRRAAHDGPHYPNN